MSPIIILNVVEWAGVIVIVAYSLISAYRDIVDNLYDKGFPLPKIIEKPLYLRKQREMEHVLRSLGIVRRIEKYAQLSEMLDNPERRPQENYKQELERIIALHFSRRVAKVGKTYTATFDYFIDIMEACTSYTLAERCARILANFIRDEIKKALDTHDPDPIIYDKIVVPKAGSPTIGFMLGHILNVPCIFFRGTDEAKIRDPAPVQAFFDGDKVIIVDDSTTGGRMFNQAILKIREAGAEIRHGFVLFEPLGKDARGRLSHVGLELHSIVKVDEDLIKRVTELARKLQKKVED